MNCAYFQGFFFFFAFLIEIFSFSHSKKKKSGIWSTFPLPSWLLILPSYMSTAPHGHMLLRSFSAAWLFLNRSEIAAPVVFAKLTLSWFKKKKKK